MLLSHCVLEAISGSKGNTTTAATAALTRKAAATEVGVPDAEASSPDDDKAMDVDSPVVRKTSASLALNGSDTMDVDRADHMNFEDERAPSPILDPQVGIACSSVPGREPGDGVRSVAPSAPEPVTASEPGPSRASSDSPVSQDLAITSSDHPARGPRRVAEMEPAYSAPPRPVVDRPRLPSMPPPPHSPRDVTQGERRVADSPVISHPSPRQAVNRPRQPSMPLPLDLDTHGGCHESPAVTRPEWQDLPQRVALLERLLRDDRTSLDVRLETLTTGFLSMTTTMQSTHTMASSAADNARQTADYLTRFGFVRRAGGIVDHQPNHADSIDPSHPESVHPESVPPASEHPESVPKEAAPSPKTTGKSPQPMDVMAIIDLSVSRAEKRVSGTHLKHLDDFRKAMQEEAAKVNAALDMRVQRIEKSLGPRLESLSLSSPGSSDTTEKLRTANMTPGGVREPKLSGDPALQLGHPVMASEVGYTQGAPDTDLASQAEGQQNRVANPAEVAVAGSEHGDVDTSGQDGLRSGMRKRRGSQTEASADSSHPPRKRQRSSSEALHSE